MSKELDALNELGATCKFDGGNNYSLSEKKEFKIVKQGLQRLEAIDNANPSEALECLERICVCARVTGLYKEEDEDVVKQALLKEQKISEILKKYDVEDLTELNTILSNYRKH